VHPLSHSVSLYIRKHDLLRAGDRVAAAVSGGADSVALLRILLDVRAELGLVLSVAHFNHKIRGAESERDQEFVACLASAHDLPFFCETSDVQSYALENRLSLESAARQLRYEFFRKLLSSGDITQVATGHTADDQAETVLWKLLRGAGTRGLAGIYPALHFGGHAIVRPLLKTSRAEIEAFLREVGQPWLEDSSNLDLKHTRNRVRHEVMPLLERKLNPKVRHALAEAAEIARGEEQFWAEYLESLLALAWKKEDGEGALQMAPLRKLPLAVQRRLVRRAAETLGLQLEFCQVEEVLALEREGSETSMPHDWIAVLHKHAIVFSRKHPDSQDYAYPVTVPARITIREAGLILVIGDGGPDCQSRLSPEIARLPLVIRNWRPGDRFWPPHTRQPKKIKELLQKLHLPEHERKSWPVIAAGNEVAWVHKLGVRQDFQPSRGQGVCIRALPLGSPA
jgi:tRNA(Ile)-lysidine synthase